MGDGHPVPGQGDPEGGVRGGVDDPDADTLPGRGPECRCCGGDSAVDEVIGVGDISAVPAEQVAGRRTSDAGRARHRAHTAHPGHLTHAAHAGHLAHSSHAGHPGHPGRGALAALAHRGESLEDLLGAAADSGGPVIEHDDPLGVIPTGLGGVVDDDRYIHAEVGVQAGVRVGPVGARVGRAEAVGEARPGIDVRGGRRGAIHVVAHSQSVPVHRRRVIQTVVHGDRDLVADVGPDHRTGNRVVVGQGVRPGSAQVDVG